MAKGKVKAAVEIGDDYLARAWRKIDVKTTDGEEQDGLLLVGKRTNGVWDIAVHVPGPDGSPTPLPVGVRSSGSPFADATAEEVDWASKNVWLTSKIGSHESDTPGTWCLREEQAVVGVLHGRFWHIDPAWLELTTSGKSGKDTWFHQVEGVTNLTKSWIKFGLAQASTHAMDVHTEQLGFDTRPRKFFQGLSGQQTMAVVLPGSDPQFPVSEPVDVWPLVESTIFRATAFIKAISPSRRHEVAAEAESPRTWPPQQYTLFNATNLTKVSGGYPVTYSHNLYHVDGGLSTHIGFLYVTRTSSGIPTSQQWWVNQAVQVGVNAYMVNPYRTLKIVPLSSSNHMLTGTVALTAGDWYWTGVSRA